LPTGTETVLLVEDELPVRELASEVLRQQGYTVLEATNGEEALELVKTHNGHIDLLLTDVIMPHMGGKALVTELKALQPNLKVVYISGFTGQTLDRHGVLDEDTPLLQKPFTLVSLTTTVREVLDS
jgi:CheY-like chemotaxis protein